MLKLLIRKLIDEDKNKRLYVKKNPTKKAIEKNHPVKLKTLSQHVGREAEVQTVIQSVYEIF
jgi:hypothetical protein